MPDAAGGPREGEVAELRATILRALDGYRNRRRYSDPPAVFGDTVDALVTAARTAERQRLAGEHAAQLAALREDIGQLVVRVHDGIKSGPIKLDVLAQSLLQLALAPLVDLQREIRAFPIPDPTAALARVRAEAVREWIAGMTDERLWELGSEEWYPYDRKPNGGGMRAGVATPAVMRARLSALTPPAGEG